MQLLSLFLTIWFIHKIKIITKLPYKYCPRVDVYVFSYGTEVVFFVHNDISGTVKSRVNHGETKSCFSSAVESRSVYVRRCPAPNANTQQTSLHVE